MKTDGVREADDDDDDDEDDFDDDIDRDGEDDTSVFEDVGWRDADRRLVGVADRDGDGDGADARGTDAKRSDCGCNFDCDCCDCCDCGAGGCDTDEFLAAFAVGFAAGRLRGSLRDGLCCADDESDCAIGGFAFADEASLVDPANLGVAVTACCLVVLAADDDKIDALSLVGGKSGGSCERCAVCGWNDIDRSASARAARLEAAAAAHRRNDKRVCMRSMTCAQRKRRKSRKKDGSQSMNQMEENEVATTIQKG